MHRDARLADTFAAILAQYRQRYLLSFTPAGVGRRGWHRLDVRLRTRPGTVVAREGTWRARSRLASVSSSSSRRAFLSSSAAVVAAATLRGQGGTSKPPP